MPIRVKPKRKGKLARRFAALPIKEDGNETLVLLVTSHATGRWVLPKGWAEKRLSGAAPAAREAFEEAGIEGAVVGEAIGSYTSLKRLADYRTVACLVHVFPMRAARWI